MVTLPPQQMEDQRLLFVLTEQQVGNLKELLA